MKLTTHLCLVLQFRMSGAVPLIPLYAFMAYAVETAAFSCLTLNTICSQALTYFPYHKTNFSLDNTAYTRPVSNGVKSLQYDLHETAAYSGRITAPIT
jgi:hypothetical protein